MIEVMIVKGIGAMIHGGAWFFAVGVSFLLLCIPAIVRSTAVVAVCVVCFGWTLMFASVIEFVDGLLSAEWTWVFLHLSTASILAISGLLLGHSAKMHWAVRISGEDEL